MALLSLRNYESVELNKCLLLYMIQVPVFSFPEYIAPNRGLKNKGWDPRQRIMNEVTSDSFDFLIKLNLLLTSSAY